MQSDYTAPERLHPLLRALLSTAHDRHVDMAALVAGLPPGALDWRATPEASPLAGLVRHIVHIEGSAAAEASGAAFDWDATNGAHLDRSGDEAALVAAIEAHDAEVTRALEALDADDLDRPTHDGEGTVAATVVEEFDHAAMHYGHMQMARLLWEHAHPDHPRTYDHWW